MTRKSGIVLILSLIGTSSTVPLSAACRAKTIFNSGEEVKVVVPFAVPVGVPVATFAPYFYSYQQFQLKTSEPINSQPPSPTLSPSSVPTAESAPLVSNHCATCHGGLTPKAELSLEHLERLTSAQRVKAIHEVVVGNMPKGGRLTSDEMRSVISELAKTAATSN
jgi:hypothetical protein